MALDMLTIADGLATRYASLAAPAGESQAMRGATARPPVGLPGLPYVVVFLDAGELIYNSGTRSGQHNFLVRFYFGQHEADSARLMPHLLRWLGTLLDATHGAVKLALAPVVDKALPTSYGVLVLEYGGAEYDGIEINVRVWTTDSVSLVP